NQERPFERPNASGGGGDARVDHAMGVTMSMAVFSMTVVAAVRTEAKPIQNSRYHEPPRYRYLLMTLNSSSDLRPSPEFVRTACSRQWSMWSCTKVFLAWAIAFSTAWSCWAMSRHDRPCSIILMVERR